MTNTRFLILVGLTLLVAAMRLLPHPDNFAPVMAVALFGGAMFRNRWAALGVPLVAMMISDPVLFATRYQHMGLDSFSQQWHVYLALIMGGCMARLWLRDKRTPARVLGTTLAASLLFFAITNCALLYPPTLHAHTWAGFWNSYAQGIPFYRMTLLADLLYSGVLFGGFALLEHNWSALREPQPVLVTA